MNSSAWNDKNQDYFLENLLMNHVHVKTITHVGFLEKKLGVCMHRGNVIVLEITRVESTKEKPLCYIKYVTACTRRNTHL